eukprot:6187570-Pleurochrysis_carterae.AAC.1
MKKEDESTGQRRNKYGEARVVRLRKECGERRANLGADIMAGWASVTAAASCVRADCTGAAGGQGCDGGAQGRPTAARQRNAFASHSGARGQRCAAAAAASASHQLPFSSVPTPPSAAAMAAQQTPTATHVVSAPDSCTVAAFPTPAKEPSADGPAAAASSAESATATCPDAAHGEGERERREEVGTGDGGLVEACCAKLLLRVAGLSEVLLRTAAARSTHGVNPAGRRQRHERARMARTRAHKHADACTPASRRTRAFTHTCASTRARTSKAQVNNCAHQTHAPAPAIAGSCLPSTGREPVAADEHAPAAPLRAQQPADAPRGFKPDKLRYRLRPFLHYFFRVLSIVALSPREKAVFFQSVFERKDLVGLDVSALAAYTYACFCTVCFARLPLWSNVFLESLAFKFKIAEARGQIAGGAADSQHVVLGGDFNPRREGRYPTS